MQKTVPFYKANTLQRDILTRLEKKNVLGRKFWTKDMRDLYISIFTSVFAVVFFGIVVKLDIRKVVIQETVFEKGRLIAIFFIIFVGILGILLDSYRKRENRNSETEQNGYQYTLRTVLGFEGRYIIVSDEVFEHENKKILIGNHRKVVNVSDVVLIFRNNKAWECYPLQKLSEQEEEQLEIKELLIKSNQVQSQYKEPLPGFEKKKIVSDMRFFGFASFLTLANLLCLLPGIVYKLEYYGLKIPEGSFVYSEHYMSVFLTVLVSGFEYVLLILLFFFPILDAILNKQKSAKGFSIQKRKIRNTPYIFLIVISVLAVLFVTDTSLLFSK